jgi:hypothetical protein
MTVGARSVNPEITIRVMAATLIALFAHVERNDSSRPVYPSRRYLEKNSIEKQGRYWEYMGIDNFELFLNEITEQNRHRKENRKLLL